MADTLTLAANCAASVLMLLAFLLLVAGAVVLYSVARALRATRRALPARSATARRIVDEAALATHRKTDALVRPHIAAASAWAGIRAGAKALVGLGGSRSSPEGVAMAKPGGATDAQRSSRASTAPNEPSVDPAGRGGPTSA